MESFYLHVDNVFKNIVAPGIQGNFTWIFIPMVDNCWPAARYPQSLAFTPAPQQDRGRNRDRYRETAYQLILKEKQAELEGISPRYQQ